MTVTLTNKPYNINYDKVYYSGLPILFIGQALYIDESLWLQRWLNGQIVANCKYTQELFDALLELKPISPELFITEEQWQTAKTLSVFGQVGRFVLNYAEDGVTVESTRLPAVVNAQGCLELQNLGMTVAQSLPQHTHSISQGMIDVGAGWKNSNNHIYIDQGGYATNKYDTGNANNSAYQDGAPVQQEAIQYPYFIQISTGQAKTSVDITHEQELNNPFFFGMSAYFDHEPEDNASWLVSLGQENSKGEHPGVFNWALKNVNEGKEGFKRSTDTDITDYDVVVNPTAETFRLPLLNGSETELDLSQGTAYEEYDTQYTAPYNGYVRFSSLVIATESGNTEADIVVRGFIDDEIVYSNKAHSSNNTTSNTFESQNETTSLVQIKAGQTFRITTTYTTGNTSVNTWSLKLFKATGNGSLYYYVGETVQDKGLIDAGAALDSIARLKAEKTDKFQAANYSCPDMSKSIGLASGSASSPYKYSYPVMFFGTQANANKDWYLYVSKVPDGTDYVQLKMGYSTNPNRVACSWLIPANHNFYITDPTQALVFPLLGGE